MGFWSRFFGNDVSISIPDPVKNSPKLQQTWLGGDCGESTVSRELHNLDLSHYLVLDNVYLPSSGNTDSTQIDHIVISTYGIFCIETKSCGGWVFGSENQKYWTHVFYKKRYQLLNPLRQNYAHTRAIERVIGNLRRPIASLVVLPRADRIFVESDKVGRTSQIIEKIKCYNEPIYTMHECGIIYRAIQSANITDKEKILEHHRQVKCLATR